MQFHSDFLEENLKDGTIQVLNHDIPYMKVLKQKFGIKDNCVVVEVFPIINLNYVYRKTGGNISKLRSKITYRLKKEGYKFTSLGGQEGLYIKEL